jgi:UDP-glucose 4-epimerase
MIQGPVHCLVTGCAGFVGSHMVDRLLAEGHTVTGYDNFSTGQAEFLVIARENPRFRLVRGDLLDLDNLTAATASAEIVFHLAANADLRFGVEHPRKDLEQNTIATFNVLEAMRANGARRIAFASSGAIYGEAEIFPTPEAAPIPIQTSLYGASKLAGEGLIEAYCAGFGFQAHIFRFVSLLGERYTHGHVFDFYKKLLANPREIEVLGDGKQRKSYLYVQDCVEAMLLAIQRAAEPVNVFNLGLDDCCTVDQSLEWICQHLQVNPTRRYTGGKRGWIGDNPFVLLDTRKIRDLGWRPSLNIRDGVIQTLRYLQENPTLLRARR